MSDLISRWDALVAVTGAKLPDMTEDGVPIANGKRSVTDCVRRLKEIPAQIIPAAMQWIPAEKRLPPLKWESYTDEITGNIEHYQESAPVLVWFNQGGFMDIGTYEIDSMNEGFVVGGVFQGGVSHWMALPDPPAEEGE